MSKKDIFQKDHQLKIAISCREGASKEFSVTINTLTDEETKKIFNLKVSASEIEAIKNFKLISLAKSASIKGFRPGKAPTQVIWKQHKDSLTYEITNDLINKSIEAINRLLSAQLVTNPSVDFKEIELEKGIEFNTSFEIMPNVEIPNLEEISLTKPVYEIKEADIKERAKKIAQIHKNFVEAKDSHKAALGDQVVIDFVGKMNNVAFEGGAGKGYSLELGSKSFIDTFEDQIVGHKKGDQLLVKVTFPDNYHEKKFAGKPAEFDVTIQEIKQSKPLTNDEELAKSIGFPSQEDFYNKIKESLEKECTNAVKTQMKIELFDKLDKASNFIAPQVMLDQEFNTLWQQAENILKNSSPDSKQKSEKELREEYQKIASRRVKLGILLSKIAHENDIKITQEDYSNALRAQIESQHPSVAQSIIKYYNDNPSAAEALKGPILEDKAVELIFTKVKNVEKSTEVEKLLEQEKV